MTRYADTRLGRRLARGTLNYLNMQLVSRVFGQYSTQAADVYGPILDNLVRPIDAFAYLGDCLGVEQVGHTRSAAASLDSIAIKQLLHLLALCVVEASLGSRVKARRDLVAATSQLRPTPSMRLSTVDQGAVEWIASQHAHHMASLVNVVRDREQFARPHLALGGVQMRSNCSVRCDIGLCRITNVTRPPSPTKRFLQTCRRRHL